MTNIKFLIFDLGHVLVDVTFPGGDRALARLARDGGKGMGPTSSKNDYVTEKTILLDQGARAVEEFRQSGAYQVFMTGAMKPEDFFNVFCQVAGIPPGKVTLDEFRAAWMEYLIGPQKGMADLLDHLDQKYREGVGPGLAILSNTDIWHWQACEILVPVLGHVAPANRFASCDLGLAKPDPEIYLQVAKRLGVAPDKCIMIDDLERNLEGASKIGMKGILFQGAGKLADELANQGLW